MAAVKTIGIPRLGEELLGLAGIVRIGGRLPEEVEVVGMMLQVIRECPSVSAWLMDWRLMAGSRQGGRGDRATGTSDPIDPRRRARTGPGSPRA